MLQDDAGVEIPRRLVLVLTDDDIEARVTVQHESPPSVPSWLVHGPFEGGFAMTRSRRFAAPAIALAAFLGLAATAQADWLVLRDGTAIETRGEWSAKGRVVLFRLPNGTLSSLRVSEVDVEESRRRTEESVERPVAVEIASKPRPPVLVLTDDDIESRVTGPVPEPAEAEVGSAERPGPADATPPVGETSAEAPSETAPTKPAVVDWRQERLDAGGLVVTGTLRNDSPTIAAELQITVGLVDADGATLVGAAAELGTNLLKPGEQTLFRATFDEPATFVEVTFDVQQVAILTG